MDKKIRLAAVKERTPRLVEALTAVWEHSVRATHHFLSESEILRIRAYVPQAVGGVAQLVAAENQAGEPVGFMGVENGRLEMLFLAPERAEPAGRGLLRPLWLPNLPPDGAGRGGRPLSAAVYASAL